MTAGIGAVVALIVAYRRQHLHETSDERLDAAEAREDSKLFNDRFRSAADQLGSDKAAIRLAGVYAMAGLADDWDAGRQTCIEVLCAYIRMPYTSPHEPTTDPVPETEQRAREEELEVRHTVFATIGQRLRREPTATSWHGHDLDFTGATIDGGDFTNAKITGGEISFRLARFLGGRFSFYRAELTDGRVTFGRAAILGGRLSFTNTRFEGTRVPLVDMSFSGGEVSFKGAEFGDGVVTFARSELTGTELTFADAKFTGGTVDLSDTADYTCPPTFNEFPNTQIPPGLKLPQSNDTTPDTS